jgi:hypothetical protein
MRSLLARLAVLSAFAVSMAACSNGNGTSLPFAGSPNNAGGSPGTIQSGGNGVALVRFIQGSPDSGAGAAKAVDVCIDNLPFNITAPTVNYGSASASLFSVAAGIAHTIAVYPAITPSAGSVPGSECSTAPGPYFGSSAISVTTFTPALPPAANSRLTIVLGGTGAKRGLYVFGEPNYAIAPGGPAVVSHNAAPTFTTGKTGVGFGICTTTTTPCATATVLAGAGNRPAPTASSATAATINATVTSGINTIPAGFYDGAGVAAGNPVPITSVPAPSSIAGQPYVVDLYAIDAPAGGLNLLAIIEQTLGFGF